MTTPSLYGKPLSIGDTLFVREEGWRVGKNAPFTEATVESFTDKGGIRVKYQDATHLIVTPDREKAYLRGQYGFNVYLTENQAEYFEALDELKSSINHRTSEIERLLADDGSVPKAVFATAISDFKEAIRKISDLDDLSN